MWLVEGFGLWKRNPALLSFLVFGYWFGLMLIAAVPWLGQVLMSLAMPPLSLGIYNGCKALAEKRKVGPDILLSGFRQNLPEQIKIGGLYLAGSLAVLGLTTLADGGLLAELLLGKRKLDPVTAEDPNLNVSMLIAALGSTPLMMVYWFAPLLAGWHQLPALKAMFFSFVACLRNWRAFLAFALGLAALALAAGLVMSLLGLVHPLLATLPGILFPLIFIPVVFASFYANYLDVFGASDSDAET